MVFRPRLRTILLIVNLAVLVLPLGGIFFFRIYENQLVRQTESELISQAAAIASAYRRRIAALRPDNADYGVPLAAPPAAAEGEYYTPVIPRIDLAAGGPQPPRPDGVRPVRPADPLAAEAGAALRPVLLDTQKITLAGLKILDFQGVQVAGRKETGLSLAHVPEVRRALAGEYVGLIRVRISDKPTPPMASVSRGTGIRVFVAMPVLQDGRVWGVVYASRTPGNVLKHMYAERGKVILAAATILTLTLLLALLTSATITRPIHRLIAQTRRVSAGETEDLGPLERPGTREIEMLSASFADMARSLHARSQYIRDFAAHVSHEFKTPLTSIQGAAELLHEHFTDMSEEERDRFLQNIIGDSDRLQRLVTRLLELARADNIEPSADLLDLGPAVTALAAKYDAQGMSITCGATNPATVRMSADNLETLFTNLVENSRQHVATRLRVAVTVTDGLAEIEFADNGAGIPAANRGKIFTPFFTTRREQGGTGLGLGIVRSILAAHGGSIRLVDSDGGATFVVALPVVDVSETRD